MSQGTFSDKLIRLEAFKRKFVLSPKIDFFPRGRFRVFWSKMSQFWSLIMSVNFKLCSYTLNRCQFRLDFMSPSLGLRDFLCLHL